MVKYGEVHTHNTAFTVKSNIEILGCWKGCMEHRCGMLFGNFILSL